MTLRLGDLAPNFTAPTTQGDIDFHAWKGDSWAILFSHPADNTPVCTTELGFTAKLQDKFAEKNTKVIALSVDTVEEHNGWIPDINKTQNTTVNFPIIADPDRAIATSYDMLHPNELENLTVRSVFIIAPDNKIKLILTYPASVGRNFNEIERCLDALQLTAARPVATPVNWTPGDDVVVSPALSDEEATAEFGDFTTHTSYLRTTSL